MADEANVVPACENTALSVGASAALAILQAADQNLDYIYDQMVSMVETGMGGGSSFASNYDFTGKAQIQTQRNGTLVFQNPFTGKIDGGNTLSIVPIDIV